VRRLVEQGPPREDVGLETYGTDPLIASATIPVGAPR
jgi:nitrate reductase delta subunit